MSTVQTILVSFGILLVVACLIIAAGWFCQLWFGTRRRAEAQMREVLGDDCQSPNIWHGLQMLLFCLIGVFFIIGMGLWTLLVAPFFWAWYRIRGKPLPTPNYDFDDAA